MTDVFSKAKRSEVMSRIRGRGNAATEMAFIRLLRLHHITGWRRHRPLLLTSTSSTAQCARRRSRVRPDFVFPIMKLAVFIDGCFWHGCSRHGAKPAANADFWQTKIDGNRTRDRLVTRTLRKQGWKVLRIWEHELRHGDRVMEKMTREAAEIGRTKSATFRPRAALTRFSRRITRVGARPESPALELS